MKRNIILILCFLKVIVLFSQSPVYPKNGTVKFSFFEGKISDTNKLNLNIKYTNLEKDNIPILVKLVEGTLYDPYSNLYTELQKLEDGKYNELKDKFVDRFFLDDSIPEHKKVYNILKPGESAFLSFNLISRTGRLYKGSYRMRAHLLNVPKNDPPYAPAEWIVSRWFYFVIIKDLVYTDIY